MTSTTRTSGLLLIALGVGTYWGTGRTSITALIPAFLGALFVVLALVARNEAARKHAMHAAVAVAVVALIGTLARVIPAVGRGDIARPAVLAQVAMSALLAVYIVQGVQSFRAARRNRKA